MTFTQECLIPVARERLWDFLMDSRSMAARSLAPKPYAVGPLT